MKTISEIISNNVKKYRKARGLSQKELAQQAGLAESTIVRIEKAQQAPQQPNIDAIAKALGIAPNLLIAGEELTSERYAELLPHMQAIMLEMLNEFQSFKTSALYQVWKAGDEELRRELEHLTRAYTQASPQERSGATQLMTPDDDGALSLDEDSPLEQAKKSRAQKVKR